MTLRVQNLSAKPFHSTAIALCLTLAIGAAPAAYGLSLSIGGDSGVGISVGTDDGLSVGASVGGDSGVNAGASVGGGSVAGVDASVGGEGGLNAGATIGSSDSLLEAEVSLGSSPTEPGDGGNGPGEGGPPDTIGDVELEGVTPQQLAVAQRMRCRKDGNSSVYDGFVAFDPQGRALGVVHDTMVGHDLGFESLRIATIPRDGVASACVMIRTSDVRLGNGAMMLPVTWDRLAGALPR
ncbi:hypothetical protein [Alkalilacustris brevis]|uniref:hypothetical protein n=1 Tax=Alkalilacustris brevis TaxID=2026338 RepID=UPI000E0D56F2|nr:hypothetical protein [Alkalilacustris brevis]